MIIFAYLRMKLSSPKMKRLLVFGVPLTPGKERLVALLVMFRSEVSCGRPSEPVPRRQKVSPGPLVVSEVKLAMLEGWGWLSGAWRWQGGMSGVEWVVGFKKLKI